MSGLMSAARLFVTDTRRHKIQVTIVVAFLFGDNIRVKPRTLAFERSNAANARMKTASEKIASESPVGRIHEDRLSTEELADLVSHSDAWEPAGTAHKVRGRVIQRIRNRAKEQA